MPGAAVFAKCCVALCACLFATSAWAVDPELEKLNARFTQLMDAQKFPEALAVADEYIAKARAASGEGSVEVAAGLSRKGAILHLQGRVADAHPVFERALAIYREKLPPDHPDVGTALNNVGMQHVWLGQFALAPKFLQEALAIREKSLPPNDPAIVESLSNLSHAYIYLARHAEAVALGERGIKIMEKSADPNDRRFGMLLQNLASALEYQGDFKGAQENLLKASEIYAKSLPNKHPLVSGVLTRLAVSLMLQRRFKEAEGYFQKSKRGLDGASITLATPATLTDFAINQMQQGKFDEAGDLLRQALTMREDLLPAKNPEIARTLGHLAEVAYQLELYRPALELIRRTSDILAARDKLNDWHRLHFVRHVKAAWKIHAKSEKSERRELLNEAFEAGQRAARTETAGTISRMGARLAARDSKLQALVRELDDLDTQEPAIARQMSHHLSLPPAERKEVFGELRKQLSDIDVRRNEIRQELQNAFPEYSELVSPAPLSADEVAKALAPDEALVFVLSSYDATYVWAISREKMLFKRVELTTRDIKAWVNQLRAGINAVKELVKDKRPPLFDLAFSHEFYLKLFSGIEPAIKGKAHLLIVPTGPLESIPFHFLVKKKPPIPRPTVKELSEYKRADWLIRSHALSTLPAVTSLKALRRRQTAVRTRKPLIAFANPDFSGTSQAVAANANDETRPSVSPVSTSPQLPVDGSGEKEGRIALKALRQLPALPETETEVKTIANYFEDPSDLLLAASATETAAKQTDLLHYETVYFATHALKAQELPGLAEPALALSVPSQATDVDDGLLTASEISGLHLDADWVVLSACNTAAPKAAGAEGLSGLAQAFFHAGARALLVSHWEVNSDAAVTLTTTTFEELRANPEIRRSEALRRAMLALMKDTSFAWNAYPTFWAPFVLVGDGNQ